MAQVLHFGLQGLMVSFPDSIRFCPAANGHLLCDEATKAYASHQHRSRQLVPRCWPGEISKDSKDGTQHQTDQAGSVLNKG